MSNTTDGSLTHRVRGSLRKLGPDFQVEAECNEEEGIIVLKGEVPSTGDRSFCAIVTRTIPGVRKVENLIEVAANLP